MLPWKRPRQRWKRSEVEPPGLEAAMGRLAGTVKPVIGKLRVLGRAPKEGDGAVRWFVFCDPELGGCGSAAKVRGSDLRKGQSSCGCRQHAGKHGMYNTPEYTAWEGMISRVSSKTSRMAYRYSGRDISVCAKFRTFVGFFDEMGVRPSLNHTLDRKDNNGHYSCGRCDDCLAKGWSKNCRWATTAEQARNKSSNRFLTHPDGRTMCVRDWGTVLSISHDTIRYRIRRGWSEERALTTPVAR